MDWDLATKGIVKAIENQTAMEKQKSDFKATLLMEAIKERRALALKQQEKAMMNPWETMLAKQYQSEHPEADFSGIPGFPARSAGPSTPGASPSMPTSSQAVMSLSSGDIGNAAGQPMPAIDPFNEKPKSQIEIGANGPTLKTPSVKDFIYQRIQEKKMRGYPLNAKEQEFEYKHLGLDVKDSLDRDLQDVEAGKTTYESVRQKYPTKAGEIQKAQINSFSPKTQSIIAQINQSVKANINELAKGNAAARPPEAVTLEHLKELVVRDTEAKDKGIDVDGILSVMGFTRAEVQRANPKDPGVINKIKTFFSGMFNRTSESDTTEE